MRIDLHTHTRASDGTQTAAELVRAAAATGLDVLGLTDHDTTEGWTDGGADRGGGRDLAGAGDRGQHQAPGPRRAPAGLPARPDVPTPGVAAAQDPRRPQQPGAGDAGAAALRRGRRGHRGRTPRRRRHRGDRSPARGRRAGRAGRGAGPQRGVPAVPQPGPAGVRQPLRRPAGRDDPRRRGGRGSGRAGPPVGPARRGRRCRRARSSSSPGWGWPASRSTTRTTRRRTASSCARSPARLDLVVTGSSDHHGLGKHDHELGCNTTAPEEYERLLALAEAASARSARTTPEVIS